MVLREGESGTCRNCGKAILGPGAWGINPTAVCSCFEPRMANPTGVHIPLQTSLDAWKQIAEERLAAVEMWKERSLRFETALRKIHDDPATSSKILEIIEAAIASSARDGNKC